MGPHEKLFIYEVPGEISLKTDAFGRDFIGCWNEGRSSFLFFSRENDEEVREWLTFQDKGKLLSRNVMDYRDWQAGEDLKPVRVEKLLIVPSWGEVAKAGGDVLIRLDPSVVFGTGLHPTTRTCLKALWDIYQRETPRRILDMGTGTGILAIAAAKLGARTVLAIDNNQLAVETALNNVILNEVEDRVTVTRGKAESVKRDGVDMLLANLHFQVIDAFLKRKKPISTRWGILSGLFRSQVDEVLSSLERWQLTVHEKMEENCWVTLVLRKISQANGCKQFNDLPASP